MSVKITYFVHGTTTDNESGISSGWHDAELSQKGIDQSIALKNQIKGKMFAVVFCSDLKRAIQSAEYTFRDIVTIIPDARLRECNYGDYNARPSSVVEPLQEKYIEKPFPSGESYEDVKHRLSDFLDMLKTKYDGKSVALVSHKAPQLALDVLLKHFTWKEAFASDWRITHSWRPGWEYTLIN